MFHVAESKGLYLALANLPVDFFDLPASMQSDAATITCLRSVLMKPEHFDWVDQIWNIIDQVATEVGL